MKTATFLIVFLFATPIFAQRGYCPCMEKEKKNQGVDLYELIKIDNEMAQLNTVAENPPAVQMLLINQRPNPVPPPPPEPVQQVAEIQQVQQVASAPEASKELEQKESIRSESRAKQMKKSKKIKRKRVRLRTKKRAKKYRGKCPKFSF